MELSGRWIFWMSHGGYEWINKVDPATGDNLSSSVDMGAWIYGIAYDGQYLWCSSNNESTIYIYDPDLNMIEAQDEVNFQPGGMAYYQDHLYICAIRYNKQMLLRSFTICSCL